MEIRFGGILTFYPLFDKIETENRVQRQYDRILKGRGMIMKLNYEIEKNAMRFDAEGVTLDFAEGGDFWRLHLEIDEYCELLVRSAQQTDYTVTKTENETIITYPSLLAENGVRFDCTYEVHIEREKDGLNFYGVFENRHPRLRVNEQQLPFLDIQRFNGDFQQEVLYVPCSLGERIVNPRAFVRNMKHTEYMCADYNNIWWVLDYTAAMTMSFLGVQSGDTFLYIARKDPNFSLCNFCIGTTPRGQYPRLCLTVSHYPLAVEGEKITTPKTFVAAYQGDWRRGAEDYREWKNTWFVPRKKPEWIQELTGFQRIIMKHQYGEIFYNYPDLVDIYKQGAKVGIKLLLVFGWWAGCFDNGYPVIEPDEKMGGGEALREAIAEIHRLGGRVLLYTNGRLIDVKTDFFKKYGKDICEIDIDGNEYREHYRFGNNGTLLRKYGHLSFAMGCHATDAWSDQLVEYAEKEMSYGADGVFFDQIGGAITNICFNPNHKHGRRGDRQNEYRIQNIDRVRSLLVGDQALTSENICDVFGSHFDFLHGGTGGCWRTPNQYPYMFRSLFPEIITTNRMLHDLRSDYKNHLNNAFVFGLRFDSSVYRCRVGGIDLEPQLRDYFAYLIKEKEAHHRFFYDGTFISPRDYKVPEKVTVAEYAYGDERMFAFMNDATTPVDFDFYGHPMHLDGLGIGTLETTVKEFPDEGEL